MQVDVQKIRDRVAEKAELVHRLMSELHRVIVGQEEMLSRLLIGLLTRGHVLLEGVPGLAKTTAIKSLNHAQHRPQLQSATAPPSRCLYCGHLRPRPRR